MDGVTLHGTPGDANTLPHQLHRRGVHLFVETGQLGSIRAQHLAVGHFQHEGLFDGDTEVATSPLVPVRTEDAHNFPDG